jgi:hypothetical protein
MSFKEVAVTLKVATLTRITLNSVASRKASPNLGTQNRQKKLLKTNVEKERGGPLHLLLTVTVLVPPTMDRTRIKME